jgi:hypothetical protein
MGQGVACEQVQLQPLQIWRLALLGPVHGGWTRTLRESQQLVVSKDPS